MADTDVQEPAPPAAPETPAPPEDPIEAKKWKKTLVVASGRIPTNETRAVIIVEDRGVDAEGNQTLKTEGYPTKGDLYYRTVEDVNFPDKADVITLTKDVFQGLLWGFSPSPRYVNVGPASPVYAAANIAWQRGAEEIEIIGLSDAQKAHLKPWFDRLPKDPIAPADVKIIVS